jgi:hypothetical protein
MKSAYELAMERLSKSDPNSSGPVTPEQRTRLAEVDRLYQGKIAEREIFLKQQLEQALSGRDAGEVDKVRKQIASEKARLEEERESEKDKVRSAKNCRIRFGAALPQKPKSKSAIIGRWSDTGESSTEWSMLRRPEL